VQSLKGKKKEQEWEQQARQKLEEIYQVHGMMMLQVAMSVLHHREDAEDAVQNSILSMAKYMNVVGEVEDFRTVSYIRTVVRNAAIDIYRKKAKGTASYDELPIEPTAALDIEQLVCDTEEVRAAVQAINCLEESYREVLSLFYLNELSPREIADVLHRPYNTVRSQINRGRKQLHHSLAAEEAKKRGGR
jgi:RNA polymerase sigma-70 factor (ECF subfamily)